jgi:hypothetical protein
MEGGIVLLGKFKKGKFPQKKKEESGITGAGSLAQALVQSQTQALALKHRHGRWHWL